jgi:hypothetical protein
MRLDAIDEPCDECGALGDVLVLETFAFSGSLALCPQCRIKAEALLRGSRKQGTRVSKWQQS